MRGYLLTRDGRCVDEFNPTIEEVGEDTASLRALIAEEPLQVQRLVALHPLLRKRLDLLRDVLARGRLSQQEGVSEEA